MRSDPIIEALDGLERDARYAWRTLRRAPLAAATIVVTVGLGLGLVAAVYTIVNSVVFSVDEVQSPHELFAVERARSGVAEPATFTRAELEALKRETNVLALRGGILEGKTLSPEEVAELATLPPVDVLRGQLVGAIVAPVTQLLAILSAPLPDLHGLLDARIAQQGDAAGAESPGADESGVAEEDAPGPVPGDAPGEPEAPAAEVPAETGEDQAEAAAQPESDEPEVTAQEDDSQESDLEVSAEAETSSEEEDS